MENSIKSDEILSNIVKKNKEVYEFEKMLEVTR